MISVLFVFELLIKCFKCDFIAFEIDMVATNLATEQFTPSTPNVDAEYKKNTIYPGR
jgi:hypothetical protein